MQTDWLQVLSANGQWSSCELACSPAFGLPSTPHLRPLLSVRFPRMPCPAPPCPQELAGLQGQVEELQGQRAAKKAQLDELQRRLRRIDEEIKAITQQCVPAHLQWGCGFCGARAARRVSGGARRDGLAPTACSSSSACPCPAVQAPGPAHAAQGQAERARAHVQEGGRGGKDCMHGWGRGCLAADARPACIRSGRTNLNAVAIQCVPCCPVARNPLQPDPRKKAPRLAKEAAAARERALKKAGGWRAALGALCLRRAAAALHCFGAAPASCFPQLLTSPPCLSFSSQLSQALELAAVQTAQLDLLLRLAAVDLGMREAQMQARACDVGL